MTQTNYIIDEAGQLWFYEGITEEEKQQALALLTPPVTDDQVLKEGAAELRDSMTDALELIYINRGQYDSATEAELDRIETDIRALRFLSGTLEDVTNAMGVLSAELHALVDFKFPFEP